MRTLTDSPTDATRRPLQGSDTSDSGPSGAGAVDGVEKDLVRKARLLEQRETELSHLYREMSEIVVSWHTLMERRVKSAMLPHDVAYACAKLLMKPLGLAVPVVRDYIQKLRSNRDLRRDCLIVKHSGLFDQTWYLKHYPEAGAFRDPVMHYICQGAKQGHDPSAAFDTRGYIDANPDVAASEVNPLVHYIRFGIGEGRHCRPSRVFLGIPETPDVDPASVPASLDFGVEPTSDIAVICHIFYTDLWREELADQIGCIPRPFDLFVTITDQAGAPELADAVRERYPTAQIKIVPNHGRDIFPFVAIANSGLLERYPLVCKLHTKKSPHLQHGEIWRRNLVRGILGSPGNVSRILDAFASDENLGLVVADGHIYNSLQSWNNNKIRCEELARRVGIDLNRYSSDFAGGSMFWIRGSILKKLRSLGLDATAFERETGALDGTMAHAIERLFSVFAAAGGYKVAENSAIDHSSAEHRSRVD